MKRKGTLLSSSNISRNKKEDSLPGFPLIAVHPDTEDCLTAGFEMSPGEPIPYGRP